MKAIAAVHAVYVGRLNDIEKQSLYDSKGRKMT